MSTQYPIRVEDRFKLELDERSGRFDLDMSYTHQATDMTFSMTNLSADDLVDIAMKILQPALYNVPDPQAFMRDKIRPAIDKLFV